MASIRHENEKVYIEGVRKVSWDTGEMSEFAAALVSALQALGDPIPYSEIMAASGSTFRFTIHPGEWDFTNYSFLNIAADPREPARRAIAAAGYACSIYPPGSFHEDSARIMDSIERGVPVLAYRIVGPSDCCIITGYDEGGQVLLGWSTFQDIPDDHNLPHDVTGYFRKPGWHENCQGYILIGEKIGRPDRRATVLDTLRWAVHLMRTPRLGPKVTGLEGLRAWADEMVHDENFPLNNNELLGWRYVSVTIQITMLRDHCQAEAFLRQALADLPDLQPELLAAAEYYAEVQRLRAEMDGLISDNFAPEAMRAPKDPAIRRAFASLILRIRDVEENAIEEFEHLIARSSEPSHAIAGKETTL